MSTDAVAVTAMRAARDYFGAIPKSDERDADETLRLYNLLDAAIKAAQPQETMLKDSLANGYTQEVSDMLWKPSAISDERIQNIWYSMDHPKISDSDDRLRFARALLREAPAGWRPIESAPKDGTELILFHPPEIYDGEKVPARVTCGQWVEWTDTCSEYHATTGEYLGQSIQGGGAMWTSLDGGFREESPPTNWMPLPAAPKEGA